MERCAKIVSKRLKSVNYFHLKLSSDDWLGYEYASGYFLLF